MNGSKILLKHGIRMKLQEIEKLIEEEREILAMHQEGLSNFIGGGFKGFISDDILNKEMLIAKDDPYQAYQQEFSRLFEAVKKSGARIIQLNIEARNLVLNNAQT